MRSVSCSVETAQTTIVQSYKHGINGFSALLTESEATKISGTTDYKFSVCISCGLASSRIATLSNFFM